MLRTSVQITVGRMISLVIVVWLQGCATPTFKVEKSAFQGDFLSSIHRDQFVSVTTKIYLPGGEWTLAGKNADKVMVSNGGQETFGVLSAQVALIKVGRNDHSEKEASSLLFFFHVDVSSKDPEWVPNVRSKAEEICKKGGLLTNSLLPLTNSHVTGCWGVFTDVKFSSDDAVHTMAKMENIYNSFWTGAQKAGGPLIKSTIRQQLKDYASANGIYVPTRMQGQFYMTATDKSFVWVMYLFNPYLEGEASVAELIDRGRVLERQLVRGLVESASR